MTKHYLYDGIETAIFKVKDGFIMVQQETEADDEYAPASIYFRGEDYNDWMYCVTVELGDWGNEMLQRAYEYFMENCTDLVDYYFDDFVQ